MGQHEEAADRRRVRGAGRPADDFVVGLNVVLDGVAVLVEKAAHRAGGEAAHHD